VSDRLDHSSATSASHAWTPPKWEAVPFEVSCARCGHDLRGLNEPRCPACDLTFDWADAVPIQELICRHCGYHLYGLRETRCPECGEGFTWQEALADYHRRKIPLFEYRWRHEPVRSFFRTWWWALRPAKFWSRLDIHDPPQTGPLLIMHLFLAACFGVALSLLEGLHQWLWTVSWAKRTARPWLQPELLDLPGYILSGAQDEGIHTIVVSVVIWTVILLGALLIFQQSMRLCKVRMAHVIRVCAYSAHVVLIPLVGLWCVLRYVASLLGTSNRFPVDDGVVILAAMAFVTWSCRCGYGAYLRMPHAWAVAISSQVMAFLALCIGELLVHYLAGTLGRGVSLTLEVLTLFQLW